MRIAIIQYGVLHDRFEALRAGGQETYYAQRYSVDYVAALSERHDFVGVIGVLDNEPSESALSHSLHSVCIPRDSKGGVDSPTVIKQLEAWKPDRLILQAPIRPVLRWALKNNIDTLPLLADSFEESGLRYRYRAFRLAQLLSNPRIRAVGNHNIPSCLSLRRIGVPEDKIYPWDWPHELRPENNAVKALSDQPAKLVFVGSLAQSKGVGDCIRAGKILRDREIPFSMNLIGAGDFTDEAAALIAELGLGDQISLAGRQPHDVVVEELKSATIALAPSHHIYPEGLPMTIYEALATRTPLALSDHPMFRLYFAETPAARMAPERSPEQLADAIATLLTDANAYGAASAATEALWNRVKCDLTWGALIDAWLGEDGASIEKVKHQNLPAILAELPK
ncbi:glycosyltransferase [Hyphococcus sp. DH-69]|uniref:glycosyltransferase n=1 Tax=Hyphococcus formosus TaxID=3143534 RepID=UPI00398ACC20